MVDVMIGVDSVRLSGGEEDLSAREHGQCRAGASAQTLKSSWRVVLALALCFLVTLAALTALLFLLFGSFTDAYRGVADVCRSPGCVRYSDELWASVSRTKSPCDDFYKHVCEGWTNKHKHTVRAEQYRWFQQDVIRSIQNVSETGGKQTALQKAALFYQVCEKVVPQNSSEVESLKKMLTQADLRWPHLRQNSVDLLNVTFYISATWYFGTLLYIEARKDEDGDLVLTISPSPYFGEIMATTNALTSRQFEHLFNRLRDQFALNQASAISFQEFDRIEMALGPTLENELTHPKVTWWDSDNITVIGPDNFKELILAYYNEKTAKIVITNTNFFSAIFRPLSPFHTPEGGLFFEWYLLLLGLYFVDGPFVNLLYGDPKIAAEHRSQFCFSLTELLMGKAFNSQFITESFNASIQNSTLALVRSIRISYDKIISDNAWFKPHFKAPSYSHGAGRVLDIVVNSNPSFLDKAFRLYEDMTTSFLRNWRSANHAFRKSSRSNVTSVQIPAFGINRFYAVIYEESDFRILPQVVSAVPPNDVDAPLGLRLGGLGSIISMALAEILFERRNEWNEDTRSEMQLQAKCILGKNVSLDHLDVKEIQLMTRLLSLKALLVTLNFTPDAPDVMIDNFPHLSDLQLFFVVWCYGLCGEVLGREMCNKPLLEAIEFSRAFDCTLGHRMRKEKPCLTYFS